MNAYIMWFIAALFYMYEFIHRVAPGVMIPELMRDFHGNYLEIGNVSAAYYYAYAIMQIPAGMLLDRIGARIPLALAAIAIAIGSYMFARTDSLAIAELSRSLIGIGSAFSFLACLQLAASYFDKKYFPLLVGFTNVFGVVGAILGGKPLSLFIDVYDWRLAMLISAVIGFVFAILIILIIKNNSDNKAYIVNTNYNTGAINNKKIILVALYGTCMVAPIAAFAELWGVAFLTEKYAITRDVAAQLTSYIFAGIAIGGPIFGALATNVQRRQQLLLFATIAALNITVLFLYCPGLNGMQLSVLLFLFGFFTSVMLLCFSINNELATATTRATIIGFTNMIIMGGSVILQPIIGYILDLNLLANNIENLQLAFILLPIMQLIALFTIRYLKSEEVIN